MAHPIAGIQGGKDENGIISITQPWWCEKLAECFSVGGEGEAYELGLPEKDRRFGTWDPDTKLAGYQIGITYEGPDPAKPEGEETYDLDADFSEQPIETHWAINTLLEKYGGRLVDVGGEQKLFFPKDFDKLGIDTGGAGGFSLAKKDKEELEKNPMFGIRSYPLYESVWIHTRVRKSLPGDLLERIGTLVEKPPGNPPTPAGRNWVIMAPVVQIFKGGTGVRITDRYKLSPPKGFPEGLHKLIVV